VATIVVRIAITEDAARMSRTVVRVGDHNGLDNMRIAVTRDGLNTPRNP